MWSGRWYGSSRSSATRFAPSCRLYASVRRAHPGTQPVLGLQNVGLTVGKPRVCVLGAHHERARHGYPGVLHRLSGALRPAVDLHARSRTSIAGSCCSPAPWSRAACGCGFAPDIFHCHDWHTGFPAAVPEDSLCARAAVCQLEVRADHPQHRLSGRHSARLHRRSGAAGRGGAARCRGSAVRRHQLLENRDKIRRHGDHREPHIRARDHRDIARDGHGGDAACARDSCRRHLERRRLSGMGSAARSAPQGAFLDRASRGQARQQARAPARRAASTDHPTVR